MKMPVRIAVDSWAGRRYLHGVATGATDDDRFQVMLVEGGLVPRRRYVEAGEAVLVPSHAVYKWYDADSHLAAFAAANPELLQWP